jgi:hypothetical protein
MRTKANDKRVMILAPKNYHLIASGAQLIAKIEKS